MPGWRHTESELLQSLGGVTHGLAKGLQTAIAAQMPGLSDRLPAADAAFLDVGVGVAKLSSRSPGRFRRCGSSASIRGRRRYPLRGRT